MYKLNDMKIRIKTIVFFSLLLLAGAVVSCDTDVENLEVQKPYTYSEQYYKNLRDYKKTDHPVAFMWFADYSSSHSVGLRFLGLPDSLDICSLWGGIPSDVKGKPNTFYNPKVYQEMRFVQNVKGTRMTYVTIPNTNDSWAVEFMKLPEEERIPAIGDHFLSIIYDNDLDGIDLDYEIERCWLHGDPFVKLVEYLGKTIGPKGSDPSKLLIVDGWPINGGYEYLSYFVSQAYNSPGARDLQGRYNQIASKLNPERFIVTENIGDHYANGGTPFEEADGNTTSGLGGQMYSLEGMARWNPTQGPKGGFGAFFAQRDYASNPPFKWFRYGIQLQNPSVK